MIVKSFSILIALMGLLVSACSSSPEEYRETSRYANLLEKISSVQSDTDVAQFLADEAYVAGVRDVIFSQTRSYYGRASADGEISLSTLLPGGTGVVNITHEIAHVAARSTLSCGCHTKNWILAYQQIALRFEEKFPGRKWSGVTPTQRVNQNISRYNIKM